MFATERIDAAHDATRELRQLADARSAPLHQARADQAEGAVALAVGHVIGARRNLTQGGSTGGGKCRHPMRKLCLGLCWVWRRSQRHGRQSPNGRVRHERWRAWDCPARCRWPTWRKKSSCDRTARSRTPGRPGSKSGSPTTNPRRRAITGEPAKSIQPFFSSSKHHGPNRATVSRQQGGSHG